VTRTPLSTSKGQRSRSPGRFAHRRVGASGSCSGGRGNVLAVGNCCHVAVCSAALGASAPTGGGEVRGISWRPPAYSLFIKNCPITPNLLFIIFCKLCLHSLIFSYFIMNRRCRSTQTHCRLWQYIIYLLNTYIIIIIFVSRLSLIRKVQTQRTGYML